MASFGAGVISTRIGTFWQHPADPGTFVRLIARNSVREVICTVFPFSTCSMTTILSRPGGRQAFLIPLFWSGSNFSRTDPFVPGIGPAVVMDEVAAAFFLQDDAGLPVGFIENLDLVANREGLGRAR